MTTTFTTRKINAAIKAGRSVAWMSCRVLAARRRNGRLKLKVEGWITGWRRAGETPVVIT